MAENTGVIPLVTSPISRMDMTDETEIEVINETPPQRPRPAVCLDPSVTPLPSSKELLPAERLREEVQKVAKELKERSDLLFVKWEKSDTFCNLPRKDRDLFPRTVGNLFSTMDFHLAPPSMIDMGSIRLGNATTSSDGVSTGSILNALAEGIRPVSMSKKKLLTRRAVSNGRQKSSYSENKRYEPYTTVRDPKVKLGLLQIARIFQFLDRGFAEYFRVALPSFGKEYIRSLLDECRITLSKIQSRFHNSDVMDLGDLGNFCEDCIQTWDDPFMQAPVFSSTHQRDEETIHYLQDALEIPYWDFMVDLFLDWRSDVKSLSGDVVLRVLHGVRRDLIDERRRLDIDIASSAIDQKETSFILEGIDSRMNILDSIWYSTVSELSLYRKSDSHLKEPPRSSAAVMKTPLIHVKPQHRGHQAESVALISLVLIFLTAAIVPGYKAFALSMQAGTTGSTNDADFWYLVQSSIMAVLGNIIMVVPLFRRSWFSPAYNLMWVFFSLGFVFACIAVAIYPLLNTGWSSLVSFFGSISSVASVLVMTQAVAKEDRQEKVKAD